MSEVNGVNLVCPRAPKAGGAGRMKGLRRHFVG